MAVSSVMKSEACNIASTNPVLEKIMEKIFGQFQKRFVYLSVKNSGRNLY